MRSISRLIAGAMGTALRLCCPLPKRTFLFLVVWGLSLLFSGCGGDHNTTHVDPPTISRNVRFTINWAARSRNIDSPTSALSATIRIINAKPGGNGPNGDVIYSVDRKTDPAAYADTYDIGQAYIGNRQFEVKFYTNPGSTGAVVATGSAVLRIDDSNNGVDGTVAGSITNVQYQIHTVEVPAGQTLVAGEQKFLRYTVLDTSNQVIAIPPGSAFFAVSSSGAGIMAATGEVGTGIAAGTAQVTATVDNVSSLPTDVVVKPAATVALIGNRGEPQVIALGQLLSARKIAFTQYETIPDPVTLQNFDVLMIMGDSANFPSKVMAGDSAKVLAYSNTGRGVILLMNAPAVLAGSSDLTSISPWFAGINSLGNSRPFNDDLIGNPDLLSFRLPPSIGPNSTVYPPGDDSSLYIERGAIQNPSAERVLINSYGLAGAISYERENGARIYWQWHPYGLNSQYTAKVFDLLVTGINWTAKR